MLEKRDVRRAGPAAAPQNNTQDRALGILAQKLFIPDGKNAYLRGELAIHNLEELNRNIGTFEHHEAPWIADWMEYLGDSETAEAIRKEPSHFRKIVQQRFNQLRKQFP